MTVSFNQVYKSVNLTYQSYHRPRKYIWQNKGSICIDRSSDGVVCYVTPHEKTDTLYVVFKGTTSFNELATSLSASLERRGHPIMHRGYLNKYLTSHVAIKQVIKKQGTRYSDIVFTGHSYGGGLSVAAAMIMRLLDDERRAVKCITYASPKCLGADYIDLFANSIPHLAVENVFDPIPYIGFHPDLHSLPRKLIVDGRQTTDVMLCDLWGQHSTTCYKSLIQELDMCSKPAGAGEFLLECARPTSNSSSNTLEI